MNNSRELKIVVIVVIILAIGLGLIVPYNSLVQLRNKVYEQKAQVENVLQARVEKIPDLVASVKSYTKHEEEVFTKVTEARSGLQSAIESGDVEKMANANEELTTALNNLNVVVEAYPELKASELYRGLNDEISGSVNRIAQERRQYNKIITEYNNKIQTFPAVMYAGMMGFTPEKYFEATDEAHKTNVVDFGD
ncbi:MAG: LemA family protein [Clostridia bacterium]|nr:LemA family protein [Clostridia bacterium]